MLKRKLPALLLLACGVSAAETPSLTDPLKLLDSVAANYAHSTGPFDIESTTTVTYSSPDEYTWQRYTESATEGDGARYRIAYHGQTGTYLQVSDGTTEWVAVENAKLYTRHPLPHPWPKFPRIAWGGIGFLQEAWDIRKNLEMAASGYGHATMLPPETIWLDGHAFRCYVVRVTSDDLREKEMEPLPSTTTFWIDQSSLVFRREQFDGENYLFVAPPIHIPFHEYRVVEFPVAELHANPDASIFQYSPPAYFQEIADLDPQHLEKWISPAKDLTGHASPDFTFTPSEGKPVKLDSFLGHPVLLDLWATWCGPCLAAFPYVARLASQTSAAGLRIITLDEDASAADAATYLTRHGYTWTNFHDAGHEIQKAIGQEGIPVVLLIDAKGQVVYEALGADEPDLQKAVTALGPAFAQAVH